jgi:hypothetical protein
LIFIFGYAEADDAIAFLEDRHGGSDG